MGDADLDDIAVLGGPDVIDTNGQS